MAAVAAVTERIRLATSVLIAPYRPPLHDARQFAPVVAYSAAIRTRRASAVAGEHSTGHGSA